MAASEKYLLGYLEDIGKSYNELIEDLVMKYTPGMQQPKKAEPQKAADPLPEPEPEEKKGFFSKLFGW
jgi:hypothetical protein